MVTDGFLYYSPAITKCLLISEFKVSHATVDSAIVRAFVPEVQTIALICDKRQGWGSQRLPALVCQ